MFNFKRSLGSVLLLTVALAGGVSTLTLAPPTAHAQAISGAISGSVADTSGSVVPNAAVTATNTATGVVNKAVTNSSGLYHISELPPGTYDIAVEATGFSKSLLKGFVVELNHEASANIKLQVAGASTSVEVVAEAGVSLDTVSSQLGTTYETKELTDLPLSASGLGVLNLSLLSPGVGSSGGTGIGVGP